MKYTGYIYIIENIINNLKYVGKTDNLRRRWNEHIRLNHSSCTALVRAIKKYGITNFKMCLCGKNKTSGGFIWKYIIERREFNEKL